MAHFMAKRSHFYNLPAGLLNITPKPDMLKISLFAQTFQSVCLRKRMNFTSTFYESLKVIILQNHTRSTLTRNVYFNIEDSRNFSGVFCRFIYL